MRLHVIARGKIGQSPEGELVERYRKRIAWRFAMSELPERGGRILSRLTPYRTIMLDERGKSLSSQELATLLARWRDEGIREARFVIGAADGHGEIARGSADLVLAFGSATWPHMLVRAMLLEQLFRATSILAGHPYHRAG